MSVDRYNARAAEIHWQQVWDEQNVFAVRDTDPRPRCDVPATFPCPSGRIHMGHVRLYTMRDVVARYNRARGLSVLAPAEGTASRGSALGAASMKPLLTALGLSLDGSGASLSRDLEGMSGSATLLTGKPLAACRPAEIGEIDPMEVIDTYGADATRWFVLSDSPPDREIIWNEAGIHGAWRFVQRVWRLVNDAEKFSRGAPSARPVAFAEPASPIRRTAHQALAHVSASLERLRFNVCVAHIYALTRALEAFLTNSSEPARLDLKFAVREAAEIAVQLFHPMMPHLAEQCWATLGHESLLATQSWPVLEPGLLVEDTVTLPVHVNGKKRADVTVARDARNGDIEASVLSLDAIRRVLDGRAPRKVIIVPQRIINVVA